MKKAIFVAVLLAMMATACAPATGGARAGFRLTQQAGGGAAGTPVPVATDTPAPTDTLTPVPPPSATGTATPQMFPIVTFAQNSNCRKGPGAGFFAVTTFLTGQTAEIDGRNDDGSWLWVRMSDDRDFCWTSAKTVKPFGDVSVLTVIPYQTLPGDPSVGMDNQVCGGSGANVVRVEWSLVPGAQGYRIYYSGQLLYTKDPTTGYVLDYPPNAKSYTYSVEAYNEYGLSHRISVTGPGC